MIVGLTGGIGSGKTTVANLFHHHFNIDIVDADLVARAVVEPNSPALFAIQEHFGQAMLTAQGTLDRSQLRQRIFDDPKEKAWLNHLLHPLIEEGCIKLLTQATSPYVLFVVPLLIESGWQRHIDRLLVIDVSVEVQIQRTCQRDNITPQQAQTMLDAQLSRENRLKQADDVIDNNFPLSDSSQHQLFEQVQRLHAHYLSLIR